jgi:hypothetical protein
MNEDRIYRAIILNEPYASMVKGGKKTIETRMRFLHKLVGDVIFCCDGGKSKHSQWAGRAMCLLTVDAGRSMKDEDAERACIENAPKRIAYPLSNLRELSYNFEFSKYKVSGDFRGVFTVKLPSFVEIIDSFGE